MKLRTPLFAPGDSPRKAEKAIASAADCVILDLEDSVAASGKDAARAQTVEIVRAQAAARALVVRVNPRDTPWYLHDLAAVVPAGPAALMLPKCAGIDDLRVLDHQMACWRRAPACRRGRSASSPS
ncbi:aldolase/citrate lyase family protein [Acidisphaera rubrifaciens]|uniref:Citrate (Pro-3S)-lyase n=1 Tax=Acidisphaera rubrifaciens HS-AP3 TaxID=1231350 RepID=A0A0D6PBE3_9PROT|nr:aldolase/citrate lyase family protein [Acidisphaera rubrifaciens]GAN78528.1 citrate (pro-3S)-lyase [Acidisphaera rubrifaciens HS-AP3]